jgi:ribulose-bisphosphate carboxylase small chain
MFGCTDAAQVLQEVSECRREYPAYIRLRPAPIAFDSSRPGSRQCQCMSFVIHKPSGAPAAAHRSGCVH